MLLRISASVLMVTANSLCWAFLPPTSSPVGGLVALPASSQYHSMTVKDLKDLVREFSVERGVLSRLKRKQDLIDFLETHHGSHARDGKAELNTIEVAPEQATKRQPTVRKMPSFPERNGLTDETVLSRKDALFEQVYQRYPPVRFATDVNREEDVRQIYHPIFRHNNASSDMDIVFVGTASCTPGTTRGVSCTALRLNWRRRAAFLSDPGTKQVSSFQGGTWLFDVGECTQVCVLDTI